MDSTVRLRIPFQSVLYNTVLQNSISFIYRPNDRFNEQTDSHGGCGVSLWMNEQPHYVCEQPREEEKPTENA